MWVARPSIRPLRKAVTDFIVQNFKVSLFFFSFGTFKEKKNQDLDLNMWSDLPPVLFHALQALQRAQARGEGPSRISSPPPPSTTSTLSPANPANPGSVSMSPANPPNPGSVSMPPPPTFSPSSVVSSAPATVAVAASSPPSVPALPAKPAVFIPDDDVASGVSDSEEGLAY